VTQGKPTPASSELTATGLPYDRRRANAVLGILTGMALMVMYVETMVIPSFGTFAQFFHLNLQQSSGTVAWILSAYLLVGTVAVPILGKLGDLYGKKKVLLAAMSVYAAAVTIAGFTPNLGSFFGVPIQNQVYLLIGARALQGVGMGMLPLAFAMIPEVFPAAQVGRSQGIISSMFAAGAAIGLTAGGWIATNYGWQFTFHTVVPAAALLVVLAAYRVKESPLYPVRSVDLPGVTSLGFGLATLMLGVSEGASWGWTSFTAVSWGPLVWGTPELFILAAIGFLAFVLWEPRAKNPIVRFASLKPRNIWVSNVSAVLTGLLMFLTFTSAVILAELPTMFNGLGVDGFTFGLMALPAALTMLAAGGALGTSVTHVGPKPVSLLGYILSGSGAIGLLFWHSTTWELAALMIPLLVGNVALMISMTNIIALTVDRRELGVQTGMNQTFRNLGTAIAPVLTTSILASFMTKYAIQVTTPYGPKPAYVSAFGIEGFLVIFGIMAVLSVAGFLVTLLLRNYTFSPNGQHTTDGRASPSTGEPGWGSAAASGARGGSADIRPSPQHSADTEGSRWTPVEAKEARE
jgi:MFS family permease